MRRAALVFALLGSVAVAAPAAGLPHPEGHGGGVTAPAQPDAARIGFDAVAPRHLDVVTGETVTWSNDSVRTHTVTADDGSFDSGRLSPSDTFMHRFTATGEVPYHCMLHPLIQGVVGVHDLLLDAPAQAAASKRAFPLSGRTALPAGTSVAIESDSGTGFVPAASAPVGEDGRFAARIVPTTTATYRAVAAGAESPPVQLLVLDHSITLAVDRMGGHLELRAKVTPASRDGRIVLQLYLPERFGWWPVQQARLGRASSATFMIHTQRHLRARVRYTLADGATALATSRIVHVGAPARRQRR